MLHNTTDHMYT